MIKPIEREILKSN